MLAGEFGRSFDSLRWRAYGRLAAQVVGVSAAARTAGSTGGELREVARTLSEQATALQQAMDNIIAQNQAA